ncbi:23S rRNA (uracil(1939)-C(5))-methyltransferase RlmD [bacterium]|nr:23S rRNA (uracil(1939)-C(5))-methyltransferase RlmD [bacterium]
MRKNEIHPQKIRTVSISGFNKKGYGEGETDTGGRLVVPYTIPGETARAEKRRKREGELVEVIEPSPSRIEPRCRHFGLCGGCLWQHMRYEDQLRFKQEKVQALAERFGVALPREDLPIHPSPPFHYRNRMDFVWWYDGRFGLRQRGKWFAMEPLSECHLLPRAVMQTALAVNRRVREAGLPFHDQKHHKPGLRYLVVRRGVFSGEIMLNFVSDAMDLPSNLWEGLVNVVSVYQLVNNNQESPVSDGDPKHLWGETCYREIILGHEFKIGPKSFFQPNPAVAEAMVQHVRGLFENNSTQNRKLVDLYCGIGVFSILLNDLFASILGIEAIPEAIEAAKEQSIGTNLEFKCMDAEKLDANALIQYNTLLVDPPRSGMHPKVIKRILEIGFEEMVYVSCNPVRGMEDIAALSEAYQVASIKLFDQFPQTAHVEMIVHLKKS